MHCVQINNEKSGSTLQDNFVEIQANDTASVMNEMKMNIKMPMLWCVRYTNIQSNYNYKYFVDWWGLFCAYSLITNHFASLVNILRYIFFLLSLPFGCVPTLHMCKRVYRNSCYATEQFAWHFFFHFFFSQLNCDCRLWLHLSAVQMNYQPKHMIKWIEMKNDRLSLKPVDMRKWSTQP